MTLLSSLQCSQCSKAEFSLVVYDSPEAGIISEVVSSFLSSSNASFLFNGSTGAVSLSSELYGVVHVAQDFETSFYQVWNTGNLQNE
jgi:hypothetical protein